MANDNKITIQIISKSDNKGIKATKKGLTSLQKDTTKFNSSLKQLVFGASKGGHAMTSLGSQFRYLSLVTAGLTAGMVMGAVGFVQAAAKEQSALIGLQAVARAVGEGMDEATEIAMTFAATGLMSIANAANTLKSLLAKGYGMKEATAIMTVMTDAAVFNRQATLSVGEALETTAEGIKNETSIKTDNVGITKNLSIMLKEYAASIGTTIGRLTEVQEREAIYQGFLKEGQKFLGNATLATNTLSGGLSRLSTSIFFAQSALGKALEPTVVSLINMIAPLTLSLTQWIDNNRELASSIMVKALSIGLLITVMAALGAILPMLLSGLGAFVTVITFATTSIMGLVAALSVFLIGRKFVEPIKRLFDVIKTGATKAKNSYKEIQDAIRESGVVVDRTQEGMTAKQDQETAKRMKDVNKETRNFTERMHDWAKSHYKSIGDMKEDLKGLKDDYTEKMAKIAADFANKREEMSISHARTTEDIKKDLAEELALGLRADKEKIADLRLRLKRENEDYARAKEKDEETNKEQTESTTEQYEERANKLAEKLAEEETLYNKHWSILEEMRNTAVDDEIERMIRAKNEAIAGINERAGAETSASNDILEATKSNFAELSEAWVARFDEIKTSLTEGTGEIKKELLDIVGEFGTAFKEVNDIVGPIFGFFIDHWKKILSLFLLVKAVQMGIAIHGVVTALGLTLVPMASLTAGFAVLSAITLTGLLTALGLVAIAAHKINSEISDAYEGASQAEVSSTQMQYDLIERARAKKAAGDIDGYNRIMDSLKNRATGGWTSPMETTLVGERGPEIVNLPGGSRITPNNEMGGITININSPVIREESDINKMADAVSNVLGRRAELSMLGGI